MSKHAYGTWHVYYQNIFECGLIYEVFIIRVFYL